MSVRLRLVEYTNCPSYGTGGGAVVILIRRHGWTERDNGFGGYYCLCGSSTPRFCLKRWPSGREVAPLARLREWLWVLRRWVRSLRRPSPGGGCGG